MSQTKSRLSKLTIKNNQPGRISMGGNTSVFLDDKPIHGVHFLKLEVKAGRVMKVQIEIYVRDFELQADVALRPGDESVRQIAPGTQWVMGCLESFDPEEK